jgi:uncharacterized membrane protein YbhN (UPF0104 family)
MLHDAPAVFVALEQSGFASGIRQSLWLYPTANVGHILSLFCFAGAIAVMDLRMAGAFAATSPGSVLKTARLASVLAFAGLAATGFILSAAEASHVAVNPVFQFKMALVLLGLLNVAYFELRIAPEVKAMAPLEPLPRAARVAGMLSIVIWLVAAACGRSIAYF